MPSGSKAAIGDLIRHAMSVDLFHVHRPLTLQRHALLLLDQQGEFSQERSHRGVRHTSPQGLGLAAVHLRVAGWR